MNTQTATSDRAARSDVTPREIILSRATGDSPFETLLRTMFVENERLLSPMLNSIKPDQIEDYLDTARDIWEVVTRVEERDPQERIDEMIRGLQFHSVEFLRRQAVFNQERGYLAESAEAIREEVYESESIMKEYLDGLLLTYVAWPNHFRLLQFYINRYLTSGSPGRCLEVGPGHGWLSLLQLRAHPDNRFLGLDISPHSVQYCARLLEAAGIAPDRFEVRHSDATQGFDCGDVLFDRIVMAEVLEHVERPDAMLKDAFEHSHEGTAVFLSTVANIECIDHLYLYRTVDEIREMVNDCGFSITHELVMPLEFAAGTPDAFEVALVCRRNGQ